MTNKISSNLYILLAMSLIANMNCLEAFEDSEEDDIE